MVVTPAVPFFSLKEEFANQVKDLVKFLTSSGLVKTTDSKNAHPLFNSVPVEINGTEMVAHINLRYQDEISLYIPGMGWMAPSYTPYVKELVDLFLQLANNVQRVYYYAWLDN